MILPYLIEKEFKQMMRNIILPIVFIVLPIGMINLMMLMKKVWKK